MDFTSVAHFGNNHFDMKRQREREETKKKRKKGLKICFSLKSGSIWAADMGKTVINIFRFCLALIFAQQCNNYNKNSEHEQTLQTNEQNEKKNKTKQQQLFPLFDRLVCYMA